MIDAHLHLWDPARLDYDWLKHVPAIAGPHGADAWSRARTGVRRAVFVQADCAPDQALAEADWVAGLNTPDLEILAIVAHAPLERGQAAVDHLNALARRPRVRGVRRSTQNEADGFISTPDYLDGMTAAVDAGLAIDICCRARQAPEVIHALTELYRRRPQARVVLDHLGKPDIAAHGADIDGDGWAESLRALAALPGLTAKISGLATEDDWAAHRPDVLTRYIHHAINGFGPDRLMFGGDWPVVDLAAGYGAWLATFEAATAHLSAPDRDAIRTGTALNFYAPDTVGASVRETAA